MKIGEEKIIPIAKRYYSPLPYHNFKHVTTLLKNAQELIKKCEKYHLKVDEEIVLLALLFHDAGYAENHKKKGFKSKEEYSAFISEKVLLDQKYPPEKIKKIKECITATHRDKEFRTIEQKIVRACDLKDLAANFKKFKKDNLLLKKEFELLNHRKISSDEWKDITKKTILFYLSQNIHLTPKYYNKEGKSIFHMKALKNLNKILNYSF